MKCPFCGFQESKVVDSRHSDDNLSIRRRRECLGCQRRFTTYEMVEVLPMVVVKKDGSRQNFDKQKILTGLQHSCVNRPVPIAELERITKELEGQQKFLSSLQAKLSNEKFVSRAPEAVVAAEREKAAKTADLIAQLEQSLEAMKKL